MVAKNLRPKIKQATVKRSPTKNTAKSKLFSDAPGIKIATKVEPNNNLEISNKYSETFFTCNSDNSILLKI